LLKSCHEVRIEGVFTSRCQGSALPTELRDHNHLRAEIIPKKTEIATIFERKELNEAY